MCAHMCVHVYKHTCMYAYAVCVPACVCVGMCVCLHVLNVCLHTAFTLVLGKPAVCWWTSVFGHKRLSPLCSATVLHSGWGSRGQQAACESSTWYVQMNEEVLGSELACPLRPLLRPLGTPPGTGTQGPSSPISSSHLSSSLLIPRLQPHLLGEAFLP